MKRVLLLGYVLMSVVLHADFIKEENHVIDRNSGLMWQDEVGVEPTTATMPVALRVCESLELDGYDDWRLPNYFELYSILVDRSKGTRPYIAEGFKDRRNGKYWTSTVSKQRYIRTYNKYAYAIDFNAGYAVGCDGRRSSRKDSDWYYVRCVRNYPYGDPRRVEDNTAEENNTTEDSNTSAE